MTVLTDVSFVDAVTAREKEGLRDMAPKIIEIVKTLGIVAPDGSYIVNQKGGAKFVYDPLYQTVIVEHGANDVFRANVFFKTVTVFKRGSWLHAFEALKNEVDGLDKETAQQRNVVHICENLGLPRP